MRALILTVLAGLFIGCMSTTRTREVHCLGALMMDISESQEKMETIKKDWRVREYARADQLSRGWYLPNASTPVPTGGPIPVSVYPSPGDRDRLSPAKNSEETDALYRQLTQARARHYGAQAWYTRVARRVQTRFEEDEILYSVLSTFVTAPASLLFYPIVRWNVRSVLWDGADPDADDDPIQQFCLARLYGTF